MLKYRGCHADLGGNIGTIRTRRLRYVEPENVIVALSAEGGSVELGDINQPPEVSIDCPQAGVVGDRHHTIVGTVESRKRDARPSDLTLTRASRLPSRR